MNDKEIKELFTINKEVNYEKALKYVCDEYNKLEVKLVERDLNLQSNWNSLREFVYNLWLDDKGIVLKIRDKINELEKRNESNE